MQIPNSKFDIRDSIFLTILFDNRLPIDYNKHI